MLLTILIIVLILSIAGGAWGYPRVGGYGWTPAGVVLVVLLVLLLTGHLHWR